MLRISRAALLLSTILAGGTATAADPVPVSAADRALHQKLLVLDTHLDSTVNFGRPGWDVLQRHSFSGDFSQVDLPRMREGGLDGGFFVLFTPPGPLTEAAYDEAGKIAARRIETLRRLTRQHGDQFVPARRADDAARIAKAGKRAVFISMENSAPLGSNVGRLAGFYRAGVRMAGPVHYANNQFADSATDGPLWHGLSPLGAQWVREMNRLGMIIDVSHSSDEAFDQMLALSKTPLIASHSGCRAVFNHPRNLDDERIRKLAAAGGVIQITTVYLVDQPNIGADDSLGDRIDRLDLLTPAEQSKLVAEIDAAEKAKPPSAASFETFMTSLLHALQVAGVDHVGIGADWDGGGGIEGLRDIADLPKITARLRQAGYSEADMQKIWSGNVLRVLRAAEKNAQRTH